MNTANLKKTLAILLVLVMACSLGACSRIRSIKLPPLPTPGNETAVPTADPFVQLPPVESQQTTAPAVSAAPALPSMTPAFPSTAPAFPTAPALTPTPTPAPTPYVEDPNIPHLYIENVTLPPNMGQYGVVDLYGNIYTDKGVIAMVWGRIVDADGVVVQNCKYYPYTDSFSLAGTVNAELHFAVLEPGHYAYVVSAIAENNSYSSGEKVLIEHPFEIYYP